MDMQWTRSANRDRPEASTQQHVVLRSSTDHRSCPPSGADSISCSDVANNRRLAFETISKAIKSKLGIKRVRADTLGYLQRSFAGCVSEVDQKEARGTGYKAAELAMAGDIDGSIAIQRLSDDPYQVTYAKIELGDVAAKTKHLDPKYIIDDCNICESFKQYLAPIVGPIAEIETLF